MVIGFYVDKSKLKTEHCIFKAILGWINGPSCCQCSEYHFTVLGFGQMQQRLFNSGLSLKHIAKVMWRLSFSKIVDIYIFLIRLL